MSVVAKLVERADSWVNAMTGLGTLRDKLMHAQVTPGAKLTDAVLEAMFNDDDIARGVVEKLPREATRRGFEIELEGDDEGEDDEAESADINKEMQEQFAKLGLLPNLRDGWIWARLYGGGSGVFIGADDGRNVDQPLNEQGIRSIDFFNLVKRPQLWIKQRYEDIKLPEYGKPEIYTVNQSAGVSLAARTGIDVHASRMILFDGALTARMTMESPTGFDDSVLQVAMAPLQQTATAWQSVAHLMTDASQGVLKIANLVDLVAAGGQETLRSRIQLMDLARSVCRAILVDAEKESFERVSTSFAGLPEVLDKLMMRMAAAANRPVTLLYGQSPAGMNATGESDIRGWYDTVAEAQTDELKPRLERAVRLMFAAKNSPTHGRVPDNWCIKFNPLWQPTDKEQAETKKLKADTYVALVGAQIMTDAEAGIGLAPDFPTIDVESREELQQADVEEGLRPREVNTPEPILDPNDPEGGGGAPGPKGRSAAKPKPRGDSNELWRVLRSDAQARVPKGSATGGQFTSGAGGGGRSVPIMPAANTGAARDRLTAAHRAGIAQSFKTGKNAAVVALQHKLVQRYGVPLKQAALLYERDIKAQLKAAKGAPAKPLPKKVPPPLPPKKVPPPPPPKPPPPKPRKMTAEDHAREAAAARAAWKAKQSAKAAADPAAAKKAARAAKAKATREANKAKKAEVAKAEAAKPKPKPEGEHDAAAHMKALDAANATGDLDKSRRAATALVESYLGVKREASGQTIRHTDLSEQGYGGYNDRGHIVLNTSVAEGLAKKPGDAAAIERRLEAVQKERTSLQAAIRESAISKDGHIRSGPETVALREREAATWRETAQGKLEAAAARLNQDSKRTLVHEEFHSFGPNAANGYLYKKHGTVAEEVTTEVLARDVVAPGAGHNYPGSYPRQVRGVLAAMQEATDTKRTHKENFELLVKASKTYKRETYSTDLMDTLHLAIRRHASDHDSEKLRDALLRVPLPPQGKK
jgi:uncharacterized protein